MRPIYASETIATCTRPLRSQGSSVFQIQLPHRDRGVRYLCEPCFRARYTVSRQGKQLSSAHFRIAIRTTGQPILVALKSIQHVQV